MAYTDDPIRDYEAYEREQSAELDSLPCCDRCGEPIQQERAVYYNDQWICEDCEADFWDDIREDFLEPVETDDA